MDDRIHELIFQAIDGRISERDFEDLQDAIERDSKVAETYLRAVSLCESLSDIASEPVSDVAISEAGGLNPVSQTPVTQTPLVTQTLPVGGAEKRRPKVSQWRNHVAAAAVLLLVGGSAYWLGRQNQTEDPAAAEVARQLTDTEAEAEPRIAGHAALRRVVGVKWTNEAAAFREGSVLPNGILSFEEGLAEVDFFCGATLIVEGPARLNIESDWSVEVQQGRLRANVPPSARGFVVKAAGSRIIDLGTEFSLDVSGEGTRVDVVDGEVEVRDREDASNHLVAGQGQWLEGSRSANSTTALSTFAEVQQRREKTANERFAGWQTYSRGLENDPRLIAYFPIASATVDRELQNAASTGKSADGKLIGFVEQTSGRFGRISTGLSFRRPGARMRTLIDGEYLALSLSCWVRVDSLRHKYNALFMCDGYETGELHWQIQDDGRLMFSVMVDDTYNVQRFDKIEQKVVTTAGRHYIYRSEPVWNPSVSGQWFHVAAVYDPKNRQVTQYVNGAMVSHERIAGKYYIEKLRIGPAELGNWGQPFRDSPWFAVRNLDGAFDELAVFAEALTSDEIAGIYATGKPADH